MMKHTINLLILLLFLLSLTLSGCTSRMAYGDCDYRVKTGECQLETI
jgi:hypothetical protein